MEPCCVPIPHHDRRAGLKFKNRQLRLNVTTSQGNKPSGSFWVSSCLARLPCSSVPCLLGMEGEAWKAPGKNHDLTEPGPSKRISQRVHHLHSRPLSPTPRQQPLSQPSPLASIMASPRFSFLAASLAVLLLATASCAFARLHAAPVVKPAPCKKSGLKYAKSVALTTNLFFHWNITAAKDGIIAAIEAKKGSGAEKGWISIGWTATRGKMCNSDVVVGNLAAAAPNNVLAYSMTSRDLSGIQTTNAVTLSATSVVATAAPATGGKIVKFTRTGGGGLAPVTYTGSNNMIWAFSKTQDFSKVHTKRGSIVINLAC
ncbi:unnamed protein product [Closterium sp. Yama58-4]|nr:unnamed protein product [Closterium sp. Yama58-4]